MTGCHVELSGRGRKALGSLWCKPGKHILCKILPQFCRRAAAPAAPRRSHQYMVELFERSGLQLMHTALQKGFPKGLFKVRMYALKPKP